MAPRPYKMISSDEAAGMIHWLKAVLAQALPNRNIEAAASSLCLSLNYRIESILHTVHLLAPLLLLGLLGICSDQWRPDGLDRVASDSVNVLEPIRA